MRKARLEGIFDPLRGPPKGEKFDHAKWQIKQLCRATEITLALVCAGGLLGACFSGSAEKLPTPNRTLSNGQMADRLITSGIAQNDRGNLALARRDYQKAIALAPKNYVAEYDLGVTEALLGNAPASEAAYARAIVLYPSYRSALYNLAILETGPNPTRSLVLYSELLRIDPRDPNVLFNLGMLLVSMGRASEGRSDLESAITILPSLRTRVPKTIVLSP